MVHEARVIKKNPKVTVITIVRNDAAGFLVTARSILRQDYRNIEWIVVDGLSSDHTSHYVRQLSPLIANYKIEKDDGIYHAMNKGIQMATGNWIFFMNADDAFYSSSTISQYMFNIREDDDIVYTDVERREDGKLHPYRPDDQYWLGMTQDHQAVCCRAEIYKKLLFDETYRIAGDYDFFSRARLGGYTFRKIIQFIGCRKPFDKGISVGYVSRQQERLRVIRRYFHAMNYISPLCSEYRNSRDCGVISEQEYNQLIDMLEDGR